MSIALSRTGVSVLRMQAAAQVLLGAGTGPAAVDIAATVSQIHRDRNQILHALRLMLDNRQDVTLTTADLRHSLRSRLASVAEEDDDIVLRVAGGTALPGAGQAILSGSFLSRPVVFPLLSAPERNGLGAPAYRLGQPAWMLLANQRASHRVHPPECRVVGPAGWSAPVIDLSADGLALAAPATSPAPIQTGSHWTRMHLCDEEGHAIPLGLAIAYVLPSREAGTRIGARLLLDGDGHRHELQRLVGRHAYLRADQDALS